MDNPFSFGRIAKKNRFCDRENEIKRLKEYLRASSNIWLYSPRRFGKTSLVKKLLEEVETEKTFVVYVDLYEAEDEKEFNRIFAKALYSGLHKNKPLTEKLFASARNLFQYIVPQISVDASGKPVFQIGVSDNIPEDLLLGDILDSIKKHSKKRKSKGVIVFDEFQQIGEFDNSGKIEKILRKYIQDHNNISYIFLGSKQRLMSSFFEDSNRPFYKSALHFPIDKIPKSFLLKHLMKLFKKSGKPVDKNLIEGILDQTECHPFFTEKLSFFCWIKHDEYKGDVELFIESVLNEITATEESNYKNLMSVLTKYQKKSLIAIAKAQGEEDIFTSKFVRKHQLPSLTQFRKTVVSLQEKELIFAEDNSLKLNDIFMEMWLKSRFN